MKLNYSAWWLWLLLVGLIAVSHCSAQDYDDEVYEEHVVKAEEMPASTTPSTPSESSKVHHYDEDEFIGFEEANKPPQNKHEASPPTTTTTSTTSTLQNSEERLLPPPRTNFYLEYFFIGFIIVYVINYWVGKSKNETIAKEWAVAIGKTLRQQFSRIGDKNAKEGTAADAADDTSDDNSNNTSSSEDTEKVFHHNFVLVKENPNTFTLKATGRVNCLGLQATLNLRKRHDLISLLLGIFLKGQDTVTVDILCEDQVVEPFVFAVLKRREEKKYRKANEDIAQFCSNAIGVDGLSDNLVVASELEELVPALLTQHPDVLHTLNNYEKYFQRMHFSDQNLLSSKHKSSLSFEYKILPASKDNVGSNPMATLLRMTLFYVDTIAKLKLSKTGRAKVDKHRTQIIELTEKSVHQQRQEAAQQRKLEKLQRERQRMETMSPEAQRKYEEKMHKKEMKKKMPKVKMVG